MLYVYIDIKNIYIYICIYIIKRQQIIDDLRSV